MKKVASVAGALGLCLMLVGCGSSELPQGATLAKDAFNTQSTVRTRVQQELANNQSYMNIDYLSQYSFTATPENFIKLIQKQYLGIAPHTGALYPELEFAPLKTDLVISQASENHYYVINNKIVANFVVPESNSVQWDGTVTNIQFYYSMEDQGAAHLMDLISKSIVQELQSPTTALMFKVESDDEEEPDEYHPVTNYAFVGGLYATEGKLINLNKDVQKFIYTNLNLKKQDYLYCFEFKRS